MKLENEMELLHESVVEVYQLESAIRILAREELPLVLQSLSSQAEHVKQVSEERWGSAWNVLVNIHNRGWMGGSGRPWNLSK